MRKFYRQLRSSRSLSAFASVDHVRRDVVAVTDSVIGVIFPILPEHIRRFFEQGKRVFIKFVASAHTGLRRGSKLFFYESRSKKQIVGEARIVQISSGTMDEVLLEHGADLFLTPEQLKEYVGNRRERRMLVLVLDGVRKYSTPLKVDRPITMAGQYMTKEIFRRLKDSAVGRPQ